jgi:NAD(P)H dehydrogenase (quinone)
MYGHIKTMAMKVKEGVEEAGGEAFLFQVAETLPQEVLEKMHAPPKDESVSLCDSNMYRM